tara:strand:- start:3008 stop:4477 length:1470 start_codon:yes stop_codon:yes gene_type:complete
MQYNFKTEPYQHQRDALEASHNKSNWAYFMEMGCGKSKVLIDNMAWLHNQGKIDLAIIVAPKGVYRNWVLKEIPIHLPDDVEHEVITWRSSPNKTQQGELKDAITSDNGLKIFVVNVEAFTSQKLLKYISALIKGKKFLLTVDESTVIKNPKAKRTKTLTALGRNAKYKRILTGSPITKSPMDLFSQCNFLSPDLLGHTSYYSFQNRYAITKTMRMGAHSFEQIVGYRNLDELSQRLKTFSSRVLKEDCLDLPDKSYGVRYVQMTPEQARHYRTLKDYALAILDDEQVTATEAMTQMLRLQQVLCGYLPTDEGTMVDIPSNRVNAMLEALQEIPGKVIIWARFRKDIEQITEKLCEVYGANAARSYYGGTSEEERDSLVQDFQDPYHETRFFVGNPQTAGYGLTLTAAHDVIYFSNDFNLETRVQSEDRCHRIGQTHKVNYIDLVTEGTVDEHIVKILQNKMKLAGQALGEEVRKWLNEKAGDRSLVKA